jgi:hypothetical protein
MARNSGKCRPSVRTGLVADLGAENAGQRFAQRLLVVVARQVEPFLPVGFHDGGEQGGLARKQPVKRLFGDRAGGRDVVGGGRAIAFFHEQMPRAADNRVATHLVGHAFGAAASGVAMRRAIIVRAVAHAVVRAVVHLVATLCRLL